VQPFKQMRGDAMVDSELFEVGGHIVATRGDFANTSPHLRWELQEVMSRVRPDDLSTAEISSLLAILVPAHSRVIGRPTGPPPLRILGII
jgi:hypothetical protein